MDDPQRRELEQQLGLAKPRDRRPHVITWLEWAMIAMIAFAFLILTIFATQISSLQGQVADMQGLLAKVKEEATEASDRAALNGDRLCEVLGRIVAPNDVGTLRRLRCVRDSAK